MARSATIKVLRTTRAALVAKAAVNQLIQGEPYFITDEDRFAVGASSNGYRAVANELDLPNPYVIASVVSNSVDLAPLKSRSGAVLISSASPVTVNTFTNSVEGQEITVHNVGAGAVTVSRSTSYLAGGSNQVLATRSSIRLLQVSGFWYQTSALINVS